MEHAKVTTVEDTGKETPLAPSPANGSLFRRLAMIQVVGIFLAALSETIGRMGFIGWEMSHSVSAVYSLLAVSIWGGVSLYVIWHLDNRTWITRIVFLGTAMLFLSLFQEVIASHKLFSLPITNEYLITLERIAEEILFVGGVAALFLGFHLSLSESVRSNRLLRQEQARLKVEIEERRRAEEALSASQASLHRMNLELELRVDQRTQDLANANQRLQDEIEQRKDIAKSLIASEEKYRTLVENANSIIVRWQRDGTVRFINSYGSQFFKYEGEELVGRNVQDTILSLPESASLQEVVLGLFEEPQRRLENVRQHRCKNGTIVWVSWTHSIAGDQRSQDFEILSVGQDVTSRREMELERELLHNELLQVQKLESIGRLAGGIAHDFNNMLSIIQMRTELAASQPGLPADAHFHLQAIQTAIGHSSDLTHQLLAFARHQKTRPRVFDANLVIGESVAMLQPLVTRNLKLIWQPDPSALPLHLDPVQVNQIMTNIIVNAMDALEGGGEIFITAEKVLFEDSVRLRLVEISPGEFVKISIRDTGPGIDPALEKKVLDPFFTTKEEGKGTGLGLAVVYGIVKQNKGYLDLKNTPGEGLEVQIYFPLWDESLPEETAPAREEGAKEGKRLLLIERAGELQSLLTTVLAKRDYTVLTATTPEEALTLANEEKEGIALYIMNALFQDKETPCLTEALLAAQPGAGLLLMSTLGNIDDFPQAQTDDLIQVIEKPFKISDFLAMVNALIEKE